MDFRRPLPPTEASIAATAAGAGLRGPDAVTELAALIEAFSSSELCQRLGRAVETRREERFAFLLDGGALLTGALDVLARERDGRMFVVDYKSDRLRGASPRELVAREYASQQLIYAIAVLRTGAPAVEILHTFLERPEEPVAASFTQADRADMERQLEALARGALAGQFPVSELPHRSLCDGCPAEGGLCSWPVEMTRREAPDRLF